MMKKLNKTIPIILCVVMIIVFYYFSSRWAAWGDMNNVCNFIFKGVDVLPLNMLRIIATLFFAVMCVAPILLTDSKWLPYVYMGILIIGTIIAKEKFLYIDHASEYSADYRYYQFCNSGICRNRYLDCSNYSVNCSLWNDWTFIVSYGNFCWG